MASLNPDWRDGFLLRRKPPIAGLREHPASHERTAGGRLSGLESFAQMVSGSRAGF